MRVLYLSGFHGVLEYNDCNMLEELGFDWFSTGIYLDPENPIDFAHLNLRGSIKRKSNQKTLEHFLQLQTSNYVKDFCGMHRPKTVLNKDFVDRFDLIFATQYSAIVENWSVLKTKPIIWRTVGAINSKMELEMRPFINSGNILPVRFSPVELLHRDSNGGVYIRNYVDEGIYKSWSGGGAVLSFQSWFTQRAHLNTNKKYMELVTYPSSVMYELYGAFVGTKDARSLGTVSCTKQLELYRSCSAYLYIGSPVAIVAYNYLEAMMTGCPLVTFGPETAGIASPKDGSLLHEPSEFIENGINGFYSDSLTEIRAYLLELQVNTLMARSISNEARKTALNLFGKERAILEWKDLYTSFYGCKFTQ